MNDYLNIKLCKKLVSIGAMQDIKTWWLKDTIQGLVIVTVEKVNTPTQKICSAPAYTLQQGISFLPDGCNIYKQRGYYINIGRDELGSDPFELIKAVEKALNTLLDIGYRFKDGQLFLT